MMRPPDGDDDDGMDTKPENRQHEEGKALREAAEERARQAEAERRRADELERRREQERRRRDDE